MLERWLTYNNHNKNIDILESALAMKIRIRACLTQGEQHLHDILSGKKDIAQQ